MFEGWKDMNVCRDAIHGEGLELIWIGNICQIL